MINAPKLPLGGGKQDENLMSILTPVTEESTSLLDEDISAWLLSAAMQIRLFMPFDTLI